MKNIILSLIFMFVMLTSVNAQTWDKDGTNTGNAKTIISTPNAKLVLFSASLDSAKYLVSAPFTLAELGEITDTLYCGLLLSSVNGSPKVTIRLLGSYSGLVADTVLACTISTDNTTETYQRVKVKPYGTASTAYSKYPYYFVKFQAVTAGRKDQTAKLRIYATRKQ